MLLSRESVELRVQDQERIRSQYEGLLYKFPRFRTNSILFLKSFFPPVITWLIQVEGLFYVNDHLRKLMFDELQHHCSSRGRSRLSCNGRGLIFLPQIRCGRVSASREADWQCSCSSWYCWGKIICVCLLTNLMTSVIAYNAYMCMYTSIHGHSEMVLLLSVCLSLFIFLMHEIG